ncbi:hypothetical protein WJX81_004755 [Elliptochloris bilobata]|uniref:Patatin n=1 Tax=Elliptochloris bilobata TaxID=381761 RepID=A0AAW1RTZ2_9CHLO
MAAVPEALPGVFVVGIRLTDPEVRVPRPVHAFGPSDQRRALLEALQGVAARLPRQLTERGVDAAAAVLTHVVDNDSNAVRLGQANDRLLAAVIGTSVAAACSALLSGVLGALLLVQARRARHRRAVDAEFAAELAASARKEHGLPPLTRGRSAGEDELPPVARLRSIASAGGLSRGGHSSLDASMGLPVALRGSIDRASSAGDAEWGADGRMVALGTADLNVPFRDLKFIRSIGAGGFGRVYLGIWRQTKVAIKLLAHPADVFVDGCGEPHGLVDDHDREATEAKAAAVLAAVRKEAAMIASLRHPNIVLFMGVCTDPPLIIMEHCQRGSLYDVLKQASEVPAASMALTWSRRLRMMLEAAQGMLYLHSMSPALLLRDLKSANLLVDFHWSVKVCDLGLARTDDAWHTTSDSVAVNPRWLAPEVLVGGGHTPASDVYAFGIVMWEVLTCLLPWGNCSPWQVVINVTKRGKRPDVPPAAELVGPRFDLAAMSCYVALMKRCWTENPAARPDFGEIACALRTLMELVQAMDERQGAPKGFADVERQAMSVAYSAASQEVPWDDAPLRDSERESDADSGPILSGGGGGIFFFWQLGVVKYLQTHFDLSSVQLRGASAGGLVACLCACNVDPERVVRLAHELALEHKIFDRRLGLLGIWGGLVRRWLDVLLPPNAAELCRGRLKLVVTDTRDWRQTYLDCWTSRDELIDACMATAHVPFFLDLRLSAAYRGRQYVDGSLQDFVKWENSALLQCDGRAFVLDYSQDELLKYTRLDFLKLRRYEEEGPTRDPQRWPARIVFAESAVCGTCLIS